MSWLGLALLAIAFAAIVAAIWKLLPENRRGKLFVRGNEYRISYTYRPIGLAIPSDCHYLVSEETSEIIICAPFPEDIEEIEEKIASGYYKLISRTERNYWV